MKAKKPTTPEAKADAKLLDLCRQYHKTRANMIAAYAKVPLNKSRAAHDRAWNAASRIQAQGWKLFDRLMAIEPASLAALTAQATIARIELGYAHADDNGRIEFRDPDTKAAYCVLTRIERLAKGGAV